MAQVSATCRVSTGGNTTDLSNVDKHNNRKFNVKSEYLSSSIDRELIKENVILIGTDNIVDDLKNKYDEVFGKSVSEYNAKQKRSDRKIYDYFEKINGSKKANLYAEVILQFGDKEFWEDKSLEQKKEIYIPFAKKQIELFKELNPNFEVANAIIHFDETTPHVQMVGIGYTTENKRGLKKQATTSIAKNRRELSKKQAIFKQRNVEEFNKMFGMELELKPKQPRRQHLTTQEYKDNKDKLEKRVEDLREIVNKKASFDKVILTTKQLKKIEKFLDDEVCITHNQELLSELEKDVLKKKEEIENLKKRSAVLQATVDRLEKNNKTYNNGIRNNRIILRNQTRNIQLNRGMERNLTQTIVKLQEEQKHLEETTKVLNKTVRKATDEMAKILQELQLVKDIKALREKSQALKQENKNLEEKNQELKVEIDSKKKQKEKIDALITSRDAIEKDVKKLEINQEKLNLENKYLEEKNQDLKLELNNLIDEKYKNLEKLSKMPINKKLNCTLNPTGTKELATLIQENKMLQDYYNQTIELKVNQDIMKNLELEKAKEKADPWKKHISRDKGKYLGR